MSEREISRWVKKSRMNKWEIEYLERAQKEEKKKEEAKAKEKIFTVGDVIFIYDKTRKWCGALARQGQLSPKEMQDKLFILLEAIVKEWNSQELKDEEAATTETVYDLPRDYVLGPEATGAFREFVAWLVSFPIIATILRVKPSANRAEEK